MSGGRRRVAGDVCVPTCAQRYRSWRSYSVAVKIAVTVLWQNCTCGHNHLSRFRYRAGFSLQALVRADIRRYTFSFLGLLGQPYRLS
jgi:hypothetical protein